ncbi:MAG TPA: CBS domain-containing protein [Fimbriiglobus sp.]|nr:CBS domain-containing protein [Fimbriiglobus sp.]
MPSATVLEAALAMNAHRIGALVVTDGDRVAGIVTERDVLVRVVAGRRDPSSIWVADVMTAEVVCGAPATTVEEARGVMRDRRIRHLPVAGGDGRLAGLVSIGDLNALAQADQERTIVPLHEYILGRA